MIHPNANAEARASSREAAIFAGINEMKRWIRANLNRRISGASDLSDTKIRSDAGALYNMIRIRAERSRLSAGRVDRDEAGFHWVRPRSVAVTVLRYDDARLGRTGILTQGFPAPA